MGYLNLLLGENKITLSQVSSLSHSYLNNWNAFVYYMADHAEIKKFGKNYIIIWVKTQKHASYIEQKIRNYFPETEEHNFVINKSNSLYITHKKGYSDNNEIIEQLIQSMD